MSSIYENAVPKLSYIDLYAIVRSVDLSETAAVQVFKKEFTPGVETKIKFYPAGIWAKRYGSSKGHFSLTLNEIRIPIGAHMLTKLLHEAGHAADPNKELWESGDSLVKWGDRREEIVAELAKLRSCKEASMDPRCNPNWLDFVLDNVATNREATREFLLALTKGTV